MLWVAMPCGGLILVACRGPPGVRSGGRDLPACSGEHLPLPHGAGRLQSPPTDGPLRTFGGLPLPDGLPNAPWRSGVGSGDGGGKLTSWKLQVTGWWVLGPPQPLEVAAQFHKGA